MLGSPDLEVLKPQDLEALTSLDLEAWNFGTSSNIFTAAQADFIGGSATLDTSPKHLKTDFVDSGKVAMTAEDSGVVTKMAEGSGVTAMI